LEDYYPVTSEEKKKKHLLTWENPNQKKNENRRKKIEQRKREVTRCADGEKGGTTLPTHQPILAIAHRGNDEKRGSITISGN